MPDILEEISRIQRSRLLMMSAQKLAIQYIGSASMTETLSPYALRQLMIEEQICERQRQAKKWDYDVKKHIELLAQMIVQVSRHQPHKGEEKALLCAGYHH